MIAHTQTIFASVALVAVVMSCCLFLVGQFRRGDGMLTAGCGLLAHALAYVCYTLFAHAPLWLTYGVANTLLSVALAFYTVSIPLIRGRRPPWRLVFAFPLALGVLLALLIETREPRQLAACVVLISQCLMILLAARWHALPQGRAHLLLILGAGISLIGLGIRVVAILSGQTVDMQYDVNNLKQTVSVSIGTVTVMMLSLGLVLLSKESIEDDLQRTARSDPLTGIANRLALLDRLAHELEYAKRTQSPLAIAMLDIDHFKRINDTHGHLVGDAVLQHCVQHLKQRLRQTDLIGRYGGEEFLLLLPGTATEGAMTLVESLRQSLSAQPLQLDGRAIALSFSAGLWCGVPATTDDVSSLLAQADAALYAAKSHGRNKVQLAEGAPVWAPSA